LRDTEQNVLLNGATVYMNVLRDTAILDLRKNNIIVLEEQLRQTRDRFIVGLVSRMVQKRVQKKVARTIKCCGNEFDLELLERVAEVPEDSILDALDEAKSAALITKAANNIDSYTFAHMLMRATLYDALSPIRRARMHERVGIALEQLTAGTPGQCIVELARHWTAAAKSGDLNKALNYTRQAGDWSLTGLAFEQAAKYYEQALALLSARDCSAEPLRCDLLIALSDAQRRARDIKYRETIAEAVQIARALGDAKRFALSVLGGAAGTSFCKRQFSRSELDRFIRRGDRSSAKRGRKCPARKAVLSSRGRAALHTPPRAPYRTFTPGCGTGAAMR
jgi:eukaryotic-like serine/threonine-protein kinase